MSLVEIAALSDQEKFCYCRYDDALFSIQNSICPEYAFSILQTAGANLMGAILVVVVNEIILKLLNLTVTFEKHYDVVIEESAILARVFIATYINSAIIVLFENSDTNALFGFSLSGFGLAQGDHSDLSA